MRTATLAMAGLLAIGVSACGGVEQDDGRLGAAQQAQLDPGQDDYVIYTLTNDTGFQLGAILVTATVDADLGYEANTEYWYLTSNLNNTSAVTFTGGSSTSWSSPPSGLGSLSFATARATSWTSGTPIGTMMYHGSGSSLVALQWNMGFNGSLWTGSMTWYHSAATNVLGPNTTTRLCLRQAHRHGLLHHQLAARSVRSPGAG